MPLSLPKEHWTNLEPGQVLAELEERVQHEVIDTLTQVHINPDAGQFESLTVWLREAAHGGGEV